MMTSQKAFVAVAGLAACILAAATPAFAQSPFAGMHGAWSGSGTIMLSDGSKERLRCRASYRVSSGDNALQQSLRCASDSYKFELSSDVVSEGGRVSGSWSETSRGISGSLQGRASGGRINVVADSPVFTANITLTTTGNKQSVSITSQGDIRQVSIAMVKS
ncbi:hypothetical protein E0H22_10865 [Rhodopseudomonas boonkerdii]|uniref:hypothetical protein n=1 Tax=Rhodopseudomonas boonkerdii TaxID=475937 RepID=UPI001E4920C3|nr:hypothetical protein [Rhodopseudomonas boonkerdii]UGV26147.1 hypothetical protein E0H22_10865 [Rhodopseudomonas boonkerdii]